MSDDNGKQDLPWGEQIGELEPGEVERIRGMNQQSRTLLLQLGNLDMQKAAVRRKLGNVEAQIRNLNNEIVSRLGLPDGTSLSISTDGKIFIVPEGEGGT